MTVKKRVAQALLVVVREWEHCCIFDEQMGPQLVNAALKAGLKLPRSNTKRLQKAKGK